MGNLVCWNRLAIYDKIIKTCEEIFNRVNIIVTNFDAGYFIVLSIKINSNS